MSDFDKVIDETAKKMQVRLEQELEQALDEIKGVSKKEAEKAYKAGRTIIVEETMDRFNQYLNSLIRSAEEVRKSAKDIKPELFQVMVERIIDPMPDIGAASKQSLIERFYKLAAYFGEVREQTISECKDLCNRLDQMSAYVRSMDRIITPEEWNESTDLWHLVEHVLSRLEDRLEEGRIRVCTMPPEKPIILLLPRQKLKRVVRGLVKNAIGAMKDEAPSKPRVLTASLAVLDGDKAEIRIADTGRGIEPERLDKIFSISESPHDATFGLYFFANIMVQLGGKLRAESPGLGHGAEFIATLALNGIQAKN